MELQHLTVALPTYRRERVLVDTIHHLLEQSGPAEIVVLDQTPEHGSDVEHELSELAALGRIRWLRLSRPSIPAAMNHGLRVASRPIILFLDDDIVPCSDLLARHAAGYADLRTVAVAGQVLQPGQEPEIPRSFTTAGFGAFLDFPFNSTERAVIANGMAGNLSMRRAAAVSAGGFDENFVGVAYRFETEFCRRLAGHGRIVFEPSASIRHLRAQEGGTRVYGDHRRSPSPAVGVGDYYFALRHGASLDSIAYLLGRPWREVVTRFHARRPWWIPVKLVGEIGALLWAFRLALRGPRYLQQTLATP
jgi:GT2 family glycosyltransferase